MNNPEIDTTMRFGSLWNFKELKCIGECSLSSCKDKDIYNEFEYFVDKNGNLFCSKDHAEQFYGIKSIN